MPTRVLVAEDDHVIRLDLVEMLRHLGYEIVADVGDGWSAVVRARELRPDLVIMCIRMPEMDGLTAATILRNERIAPVMLISAMNDAELIARACEAGVVMYLTKPARESDLKSAIEVALARHHESLALEERVRQLQEQLATRKVVESAVALLMEGERLTYRDAFRRVQKLSMTRRIPMREAAEAILLATER
jgi:two-component system, response regulator PdtaR